MLCICLQKKKSLLPTCSSWPDSIHVNLSISFFFFIENNLSISHQSKKNTTSVQAVAHTQMQKILERGGGGYGPLPYTLYQTCMMLYKYTCKLLYSKAIVLHVFFPLQKKKILVQGGVLNCSEQLSPSKAVAVAIHCHGRPLGVGQGAPFPKATPLLSSQFSSSSKL